MQGGGAAALCWSLLRRRSVQPKRGFFNTRRGRLQRLLLLPQPACRGWAQRAAKLCLTAAADHSGFFALPP